MTTNTPPPTCHPQPRPGVTARRRPRPRAQLTAPRASSPRHTRSAPTLAPLPSTPNPEKLPGSLHLLVCFPLGIADNFFVIQSHPCGSIASLTVNEIISKLSHLFHRQRNGLEAAVRLPKVTSSARAQVHLSGNGKGMCQK